MKVLNSDAYSSTMMYNEYSEVWSESFVIYNDPYYDDDVVYLLL